MNYYISYFYQLRFFPKNALPLSTAIFDPKWFHEFQNSSHKFLDKRGVWNGFRAEPLCPKSVHIIGEQQCHKNCEQSLPCLFMTEYYKYLKTLDFLDIITRAQVLAEKVISKDFDDPFVIFLVHEPPYIKCAERPVLQRWFEEEGEHLPEWSVGLN